MKYLICLILTILLSVSLIGSTALAQLPGDCNGSGMLDIDDAVFLISYLVGGGPEPLPASRSDCDCDNNPGISLADAAFIVTSIFPPRVSSCSRRPAQN